MRYSYLSVLALFAFVLATHQAYSQVNEKDSLALVAIYNAMDGPNWVNQENWLTGPVDSWQGVTTSRNRVTRLYFSDNGLKGRIPAEFNDLDTLISVDFREPGIEGPLPKMDGLGVLEFFSFEMCPIFSGFPEEIRDLKSIKYISLYACDIPGELPDWLSELENLERLSLPGNEFEGDLIGPLEDCKNLKEINVWSNNFSGSMPDLSFNPKFESIDLAYNDFSGPFPTWVTNIDSLVSLDISACGLEGEVPDGLFSQMNPDMAVFEIHTNSLSGDVARWMDAPMNNLYWLSLSNNDFHGKMPDNVFDIHNIYRWAVINTQISGIPDFTDADHRLTWFYIQNNKLGFEHLESCLNLSGPSPNRVILGPQNPLLEEESLEPNEGDRVVIESGSAGSITQYQWYLNGNPIQGETGAELVIDSYSTSDKGTYHCEMTHDSFPFTLTRNPVEIGLSVSNNDNWITGVSCFPNPGNDWINVSGITETIEEVIAIDPMGKSCGLAVEGANRIDVNELTAGNYNLILSTATRKAKLQITIVR